MSLPESRSVAVDVADVSLAYRQYKKPADLLMEGILGSARHDTFWALRNINLQVHEGQRLGLIGPNGAGKSTLLQVIAGNLSPTSGKVRVSGKISSLLSLTPVWNGEDSGIENIRFNLMVQGAKSKDIPRLTEEIVDFADLGAFIYQPVKTYSSGMSARLAFAIATAIEPEILIIDEVLGAGDGYFAARATKRMQEMCAKGKALLFVSHSTAAVRMMCDSCAWIENGVVREYGAVDRVVNAYENDMLAQDQELNRPGNRIRLAALRNLVPPSELVQDGKIRLRVRSDRDVFIKDTHFVRNVHITLANERRAIPIDEQREDAEASLELFSCEWARYFQRGGQHCRILQPRAGAKKGGHLWIRNPAAETGSVPVVLEYEYSSLDKIEVIVPDILDLASASWAPMKIAHSQKTRGWTQVRAEGIARIASAAAVERVHVQAKTTFQKPVEIESIDVLVEGQKQLTVPEFTPFTIRVVCKHNEAVPRVSINLGVWRADGVNAWWAPSGYLDGNIENYDGRSETEFRFDPNPFGYGRYLLNVYAVDGFAWDNCPNSEIYDQSVSEREFQIGLSRPIEFGLMNFDPTVTTKLDKARATVQAKRKPARWGR